MSSRKLYSYTVTVSVFDSFRVRMPSPLGVLELVSDGDDLTALSWVESRPRYCTEHTLERPHPLLWEASHQLDEYFAGTRKTFDMPVRPIGTPFQTTVWDRVAALPWGTRSSYGQIAAEINKPDASRAVGRAVGANPVPIIIGCHRVLSSNGEPTGYSGGAGIPTKLWLLGHESITWTQKQDAASATRHPAQSE
jgi:methylated-DNA-[protein]-cysteine S-methyltransferase